MAFWNKKPSKRAGKKQTLELVNWGNAFFSDFGNDVYKSSIARSCIRPIAEATSKLNIQVIRETENGIESAETNKKIQEMLSQSPNPYMNGKDFLYKVRTLYEATNTAFIFIDKPYGEDGEVAGYYPVPYDMVEARLYDGEIFFCFTLPNGEALVCSLSEVAILRQDYYKNYLYGERAVDALLGPLQLIHTTNEGMANAIKTSANLKAILKSTKGMISDQDRKELRDNFVSDYMNLENESGVAVLDSAMEFTQLRGDGVLVNAAQMKELRENVMRYFGVNDNILMSKFTAEEWEAFYESKIEPFALALGLELTNKTFGVNPTNKDKIIFSGNRLLYASTATKLSFTQMVDRGEMTPNEHRAMFGLPPREGGDEFVIRGEYVNAKEVEENAE